jgi:hypothetical protein
MRWLSLDGGQAADGRRNYHAADGIPSSLTMMSNVGVSIGLAIRGNTCSPKKNIVQCAEPVLRMCRWLERLMIGMSFRPLADCFLATRCRGPSDWNRG